MTNEQLLEDAQIAIEEGVESDYSTEEKNLWTQRSIAASLLVLARNSEPTSEESYDQMTLKVPRPDPNPTKEYR